MKLIRFRLGLGHLGSCRGWDTEVFFFLGYARSFSSHSAKYQAMTNSESAWIWMKKLPPLQVKGVNHR